MKHILVLLSILVISFIPFQPLNVKAETNDNINDFMEYDSFQKRYNEHLGDLLYLTSVSYDSNDHYFKENIQVYRDLVDETFDEGLLKSTLNTFIDGVEYFRKPISFLSAANDFRKGLLDKIKGAFTDTQYPNENGNGYASAYNSAILTPPNGYWFKGDNGSFYNRLDLIQDSNTVLRAYIVGTETTGQYHVFTASNDLVGSVYSTFYPNYYETQIPLALFMQFYYKIPTVPFLSLVPINDTLNEKPLANTTVPPAITNIYNRTVNNFNENQKFNDDYIPNVIPQLVCPSGTHELQYVNGSFSTKARQSIILLPDETVDYNGVTCNLDFRFPVLDLNEVTGDVTADGVSLVKIPSLPVEVPSEYDMTILGYIRNSYEYATTVISNGVDGLRSIVVGTTGLVTFTGSMFAFLPPEIVTLFVGGFAIALGLWVFKR